jgi:hypothetical protein
MSKNLDFRSPMWETMIDWVKIKICKKVQNAQKAKNWKILSFWVRYYRFFQKKVAKSWLRGGAEFGTHVLIFFELSIY